MNLAEENPFSSRLRADADLSKTNWFRVGGRAEWLFKPESAADLAAFLGYIPREMPVIVLGVGSNVIIRDGGIDGVVVKLGRGFAQCQVLSAELRVGAGCLDLNVAQFACEHSIGGLEFLSGIPGTIGGAVRMNAGAYGSEMKDVLISADVVHRDGTIKSYSNEELGFRYRGCALPEGSIVVGAALRVHAGDQAAITARMQEIARARETSQPVRARTGGSTFRNPEGHKAWELIDAAGCRGLRVGGAEISSLHCNFLINTGDASAHDLETLGEEVRARVKAHSGVELEWEIKRIGRRMVG